MSTTQLYALPVGRWVHDGVFDLDGQVTASDGAGCLTIHWTDGTADTVIAPDDYDIDLSEFAAALEAVDMPEPVGR
ncbi:MAG TPA: hypothetical protein VGF55_17410 [Gemmataceae bacterium]|jgi:hypothetical protein